MRILMIAPEPFFEPRGTPFSEFHRIRALTALGHQVDLVTYPFGENVSMPGLRVLRSLRPPFVKRVKIGPSAAKFPLDALLALTAFRVGLTGKYDAVHSHEEGGVIGVILSALLRVPHLYDMHSSLPQQLTNFAFTGSTVARGIVRWFEKLMINRSRVVIVSRVALATPADISGLESQLDAPVFGLIPPAPDLCAFAQNAHVPLVVYDSESLAASSLNAVAEEIRRRIPHPADAARPHRARTFFLARCLFFSATILF